MSATAETATRPVGARRQGKGLPGKRRGWRAHIVLGITTVFFLLPIVYAFYTSLRPYKDTADHGYVSIGGSYNFANYKTAWTQADLPHYYLNTLIVTVPAILITLLLASMVAFGISRYSWRFNLTLLIIFTAGNLLPQQVIITPLYRMFLEIPLPEFMSDSGTLFDSFYGIILIHVAFQVGFCVFVLANYMDTVPKELIEASIMDGAGVWRQYRQVILPLVRPALGALGTLEFAFIYNDFLWAVILMSTGDKFPVTSALNNLRAQFFTDYNLLAAGSILIALPTVLVFLLLQRQFISGLTLGSTKG
jgi:multiple sugar transport system permease protein